MTVERSRRELAIQINHSKPEEDEIFIWWIGQSGFVIKSASVCLVIDPYLSTTLEEATKVHSWKQHTRMYPIAVWPHDLQDVDYILCSHTHRDHYDPDTIDGILAGSPQARLIVPKATLSQVQANKHKTGEIISIDAGQRLLLSGVELSAIASKHNEFDRNEAGEYPYLGYILGLQKKKIYHAGDTVYYHQLEETLKRKDLDVGFLPINGYTDELIEKGFASNFTYAAAVEIAALSNIGLTIPCHYDMFTINTEQVGRFVNFANRFEPRINYRIPIIGEAIKL